MSVFFIGCLHLGHRWMAEHRGFNSVQEHDEKIISTWNAKIHKKDLVWILGDITMETPEHYPQLNKLNGRKKVVLGNHDMPEDTREMLKYVETVSGMVDYKGYILTHCPIHPAEISFCRGNIHAHIHENKLNEVNYLSKYGDPGATVEPTLHKYHCVDAHMINYNPLSLDEINKGIYGIIK